MTRFTLLAAILLSGMLCLTGCGGGSGGDSSAAPATPASNPGSTVGDPPVDPNAATNAAFAAITPAGIKQTGRFIIGGSFSTFNVVCDAIDNATSYKFTTSFGASASSPTPVASLHGTVADAGLSYTLSVYASNSNNVNTKTGSANVN